MENGESDKGEGETAKDMKISDPHRARDKAATEGIAEVQKENRVAKRKSSRDG